MRSRIFSVESLEAVTRKFPDGWKERAFTGALCTAGGVEGHRIGKV